MMLREPRRDWYVRDAVQEALLLPDHPLFDADWEHRAAPGLLSRKDTCTNI